MVATIKSFLTAYILGVIGLIVLSWALATFADIDLPGGMGVVPFVIGVQYAANAHVNRGGGAVTGGEAWGAAFGMTLAAMIVRAVLVAIMVAAFGGEALLGPEMAGVFSSGVFAIVLAVVFAFYVLMARFGYGWMVRTALKAKSRGR